jgi:parvulin-like peptidyl-prolyl isomerase
MRIKNSTKITVIFMGLTLMLAVLGCEKNPSAFTDNNVVAQFVNGVITTDQLTAYISKVGPKCHTPVMSCHSEETSSSGCGSDESCDMHDSQMEPSQMEHGQSASAEHAGMDCCGGEHGGEHSGCCGGSDTALADQSCDEHENCCTQHYDLKLEDYKRLVRNMVMEQMLQEYIRENGIGQEENVQDMVKYVTENVYITDTHLEMEESMKPAESEIREYYEKNKRQFGLRTLSEARDEIAEVLKKKMHHEYMPRYLAELERNAFIRKDLELIKPQELAESELRSFYREHRSEYEEGERLKVRQILTHSREKAEQAQSQLRSGETFAAVAEEYSEGPFAGSGGEVLSYIKKGDRGEVFEENVSNLREGDTSILFEDKGSFYIVQVIEKRAKRVKSFEEIADSIRESLMIEKEKKIFEDNAQRTLFTVNSRGYTVEEFERRYDSLPLNSRAQFSGLSGKEKLIDRMVEYELLADDARHKMFDLKNEEAVEDITNSILRGALYEEVVSKIGIGDISDEEARGYYDKNREKFIQPPRAKISFIRVPASSVWGDARAIPTTHSEDEGEAAKRMAYEAYAMAKGGTEFDVVARKYSADDWSSRKLDMYEEKGLPVASASESRMHSLHKIVFSMREGEVSRPVEFQNNFYIFKLWEKSEKSYVAFDDVKGSIRRMMVSQKQKDLAETLKDDLMEKSHLVLNHHALEAMAGKKAEKASEGTEESHGSHAGHTG